MPLQCSECIFGFGGSRMKTNNPLNIKIDDRLLGIVNTATIALDCSLSELVRACLEIGIPVVIAHPDMVKLLPFRASGSIKHG
jgi:hypothetical protein